MKVNVPGLIVIISLIVCIAEVIFIPLKLCKVIYWSWLWVVAPIWVTLIVISATTIFISAVLFLSYVIKKNLSNQM